MTDDRLHRRAVTAFHRGEASRWVVAHDAYHLEDITGLVADLPVGRAHVLRLQSAYAYYRALVVTLRDALGRGGVLEMRTLRKALSVSHFFRMGEMARRFDIDAFEAREYLRTAALEGVSVRAMEDAIEGENGDDGRPEYMRRFDRVAPHLRWIAEDGLAPERIRWLAAELVREIGGEP